MNERQNTYKIDREQVQESIGALLKNMKTNQIRRTQRKPSTITKIEVVL